MTPRLTYGDRFIMVAMDTIFERHPELCLHTCLKVERGYARGPAAVVATCCQGEIYFSLTDIEFQCIQCVH